MISSQMSGGSQGGAIPAQDEGKIDRCRCGSQKYRVGIIFGATGTDEDLATPRFQLGGAFFGPTLTLDIPSFVNNDCLFELHFAPPAAANLDSIAAAAIAPELGWAIDPGQGCTPQRLQGF